MLILPNRSNFAYLWSLTWKGLQSTGQPCLVLIELQKELCPDQALETHPDLGNVKCTQSIHTAHTAHIPDIQASPFRHL